MEKSSITKNSNWFSTTETLLVVSSIGASVASLAFRQFLLSAASIPLSLALGLNSWNRRRLYEIIQQNQTLTIRLEQRLKSQELLNQARPTENPIESRFVSLEASNDNFSAQIKNLRDEVANLHESLCNIQGFPQSFRAEFQEVLARTEGQIQALESQLSDLPIFHWQYQLTQLQQLLDELQIKTTGSIQDVTADIEAIRQQLKPTTHVQANDLKLYIFDEIQASHELIQESVLNQLLDNIKITEEQLENNINIFKTTTQTDIAQLKKQYNNIFNLVEQIKNNPRPSPVLETCAWCKKVLTNSFIRGGEFHHYKFHNEACKREYERRHGLL